MPTLPSLSFPVLLRLAWTHYVAKVGFELLVLLLLPAKCWNYGCVTHLFLWDRVQARLVFKWQSFFTSLLNPETTGVYYHFTQYIVGGSFFNLYLLCVCMFLYGCGTHTIGHMKRLEEILWVSCPPCLRDWTRVGMLGNKHLGLLSSLATPYLFLCLIYEKCMFIKIKNFKLPVGWWRQLTLIPGLKT